jgi:TfoX/Sxy family transcriptional regulator of competence genes
MRSPELDALQELLDAAAEGLPGITARRMFGCHALFASGVIFALVWKTGRLGLKLPIEATFEELMALPGADPWTAGTKTMSQWVLVPVTFHTDHDLLKQWVHRAHGLATASAQQAGSAPAPRRRAKHSQDQAAKAPPRKRKSK